MIALDKHIEILLLDNDCVIVPQLGGFVAHYVEARYDKEDNNMLPPYRTVGFNQQLKLNDSLLVQSYIEAYDISYPEALKRINAEVNELRQVLEYEGYYHFNGIGKLYVNKNGSLQFDPYEAGILTPSLYALDAIEVYPVKQKSIFAKSATKAKNRQELLTTHKKAKLVRMSHSIASNIAVAVVVGIAFLLFAKPMGQDSEMASGKQQMATSFLRESLPGVETAVNVKSKQQPVTAKTAENAAKPAATAKKTTQPQETKEEIKSYYSIVLASRVTNTNARNFVKELHSKGMSEAFVLDRKVGAKVICGKYKTEAEAYKELGKITDNTEYKDAWVMFVNE